jgi:hypothetical protein
MNMRNSRAIDLALVLAGFFALGGCVVEPIDGGAGDEADVSDDGAPANGAREDAEENVASVEQAVYSGWTAYTSEEYPPVSCDAGSVVDVAQCSGWYCDNISLSCHPSYRSPGPTTWTSYFSEEGTNYRYCPSGAWLSGIACSGWYCDNIALQCTTLYSTTAANCYWTGWMSEEGGGTLFFGIGYYARGVQCDGAYCDNKRYYVCQMY